MRWSKGIRSGAKIGLILLSQALRFNLVCRNRGRFIDKKIISINPNYYRIGGNYRPGVYHYAIHNKRYTTNGIYYPKGNNIFHKERDRYKKRSDIPNPFSKTYS